MADGPSVPEPGCGAKLTHLWLTNKPLAIFLIFLATALVAGIIFLIVWFLIVWLAIIVPSQKKNEAEATKKLEPADSASGSTAPAGTPASAKSAHFMRLRHN